MRIIINESQLDVISKHINEAALPSFSLEELSNLKSFKDKVRYCVANLGKPIGNGSSRQVFQIDDEKILKLAKNNKGLAQNQYEGQDDYYKEDMLIFPKVYDKADDFSWIVSEYVLPAKNQDFIHCLGMSFDEFRSIVAALEKQHKYSNSYRFVRPISKEELWDYCDNNKFISELNDYIGSYDIGVGDLYCLSTYGLAMRNGQPSIVILDSGLSEYIYDTYYNR